MRALVHALKGFAGFLYDFLVGDDWHVAAVVVVAMAVTAVIAHHGGTGAWWVILAALAVVLPLTVWKVVRASRDQ